MSKSYRGVQRDLTAFEERNWVEKRRGTYHLTTYGEAIANEYRTHHDRIEMFMEYGEFVSCLPSATMIPDPNCLRDATVSVADSATPHAPLNHYRETLRSWDYHSIRGLFPGSCQPVWYVHGTQPTEGVNVEFVVGQPVSDVLETFQSVSTSDGWEPDEVSLYRLDEPIEVGVTLFTERGILNTYENGQLTACATFGPGQLLDWAINRYRTARNQSTAIDGGGRADGPPLEEG
ncbi:hypothetical protein [Haloarchaeobius sp. DYHT-AS-18]|uniref:transcriptional regulator FilR1 domain-containing protein n=1 Tax=Haloarchaeobius sp. DYHT-AS-18 TaxID=3446117 RepID=UPI003EBBB8F1